MIIKQDSHVDDLIVVAQGKLDLFGFYTHRGQNRKMLILHLPEQSWYGDFQIFLQRESVLQLEAGQPEPDTHFVQVYKLKGSKLLEIIKQYPIFFRFAIIRASQRRSQFLRVFDEMRQMEELKLKSDAVGGMDRIR